MLLLFLCVYRESEDTVLLILKEIHAARGIMPIRPGQDNVITSPLRPGDNIPSFPRHPMANNGYPTPAGVVSAEIPHWDAPPGVPRPVAPPTAPPGGGHGGTSFSPPPLSGFVRK